MLAKPIFNKTITGLTGGIVIPVIAFLVFYLVNNHPGGLAGYVSLVLKMEILSHIISICVIPNLLLFFIFIWTNKLYSARGVIFATIVWAFVVLVFRFFI